MAITLHPGTPADAPAIFKVHYEALSKYHAFYAAFFVNHPRDILKQSTAVMLDDPSTRVLVAVKDDEEVVGFVRWEVHGDVEKETPKSAAMRMLVREKECLGELFEEFGRLEDEKERHYSETFQGRSHFYIKHLMISPNHQNQRIGTALLTAVLRESDKAQCPTVLVSSAEAMALYRRAGFKELLAWRIDNEAWAKRIVERMREEEEVEDGEGLVGVYRGVEEVETYMVRWSEGRDGGDGS